MKTFTIIILLFSLLGVGFYAGYIFYGKKADDLKIDINKLEQQTPKEIKNIEPKERITTTLEERNGIAFVPNEQEPFTGKHEEFYSNGQKKNEANYVDGKKNGLSISWYENGQKDSEFNYKNGKMNGVYTLWQKNGNKGNEGSFKDGQKDGLDITYSLDKDGNKFTESTYVNGKETSNINFQKNGQKIFETIYMDDGRELVTSFSDNGQKEQEWYQKDGKQITKPKSYKNQDEEETNATVQEIINRCRTQMGKYGAAMVKSCVDQDIEAENALRKY